MSLVHRQRRPEATKSHMGKVEADPPLVTPRCLPLKRLSRGTQLRHIQVSGPQTLHVVSIGSFYAGKLTLYRMMQDVRN